MMNNYSSQDFLSVARRITYDATIPELLEEAVRNHEDVYLTKVRFV